ncbi:hypothetical protein C8Q74DRAFT_554127 [Fomes fomentarius]|nr:hypothetical protein C8Q74DRAFT_554127 [Fomes fomentarius]
MHGRVCDVKCTKCDCLLRRGPHRPAVSGLGRGRHSRIIQTRGPKSSIFLQKSFRIYALAPAGNGMVRRKTTPFGRINSIVYKAGLCLVIGTSSTVRPTSIYAYRIQRHCGKVAVFNLTTSRLISCSAEAAK